VRKETLQCRHRFLGAILLPEREDAVDDNHGNDCRRQCRHALARHPQFGDERKEGGCPEQDGEEVGELSGEA
jgi:hypothetical protein